MNNFNHFAERLESGARKALPYGLLIVLLLLNSVPMPFIAGGQVKAPFFLMGIYYWSIYRPTLIPPWMAFAAGLAADFIGGLPLGFSAASYVLAQWLVTDQRRFLMGQSFAMIWFGFLVLTVFISLIQWLIFAVINFALTPLKPIFFSLLFGQALFPLICVCVHWTHRMLPTPARVLEPR